MRDSGLFGSRFVGIAIAAYVVLVLAASFYFKISLSVDRVAILIVIAALGTGKIRSFLRDWSAFLVVILAWQVLQGMSQTITHIKPHVTEMIVVDKFLFLGRVPTIWLQHHLYHPGHIAWYDIAATILYSMHFLLPLAVGFVLWIWKRPVFGEFTGSFMLLALAGFATYMLFPAAPPWWAAKHHYLPYVTKIFQYGLQSLGGKQSYSTVTQWAWQHGGWDVFGAMPSEHAALPFLCFLYARKAWNRAGWLLLPYCLGVWVAVIYLGEHYAADVIAGILYASAVYVGVQIALARKRSEHRAAHEPEAPQPVTDRLPA